MELKVDPAVVRHVARGAAAEVPLPASRVPLKWIGVPWGTVVVLRCGETELFVPVGPARYRAGHWALPVLRGDKCRPGPHRAPVRRCAAHLRREYKLND
jgi:hypothetical protein